MVGNLNVDFAFFVCFETSRDFVDGFYKNNFKVNTPHYKLGNSKHLEKLIFCLCQLVCCKSKKCSRVEEVRGMLQISPDIPSHTEGHYLVKRAECSQEKFTLLSPKQNQAQDRREFGWIDLGRN